MSITKPDLAAQLSLPIPEAVKRIWSMYPITEQFQRLRGEILWIITGQATAILGAVVGIRMLTGVLSPTAYGELALGMTGAMLINQIVLGPLSNASLRFFAPAQEAGEFPSFLLGLRSLLFRATIVMTAIASIICLNLLLLGQLNWIWLGAAAFGFAAISGYNSVLDGVQNAARQRAIVAWHGALASWGRFLAAVGLVILLGAYSAIAMLGYMLASVLVLLSQGWFLKHRPLLPNSYTPRALPDPRRWESKMFDYAWPFASWGIFTWMQMASDRWALQIFTSTKQVGLYVVLYQLGYYPILLATGMVVQLLAPIFYQRAGDATDKQRIANVNDLILRLTGLILGVTGIVFFAAFFFHRQIFQIFVAKEYASVSHLLQWMLLAAGLFAAGQNISQIPMSQMKSHIIITPKIVTALLGTSLNLAGAYWYGTRGVVIASLLFSLIYFLWMVILLRFKRETKCL